MPRSFLGIFGFGLKYFFFDGISEGTSAECPRACAHSLPYANNT